MYVHHADAHDVDHHVTPAFESSESRKALFHQDIKNNVSHMSLIIQRLTV
jgi:hypothetical protein